MLRCSYKTAAKTQLPLLSDTTPMLISVPSCTHLLSSSSMKTSRALNFLTTRSSSPLINILGFLCPSLLRLPHITSPTSPAPKEKSRLRNPNARTYSAIANFSAGNNDIPISQLAALPLSCPGCGALTQDIESDDAGFYSMDRKSVKECLQKRSQDMTRVKTEQITSIGKDEGSGSAVSQLVGLDKTSSKTGRMLHLINTDLTLN